MDEKEGHDIAHDESILGNIPTAEKIIEVG